MLDPKQYKGLDGKLNYFTVTRPNISFAISVVSQFLNSPCEDQWSAVIRILKYIKGYARKGCYMVLITIKELFIIQLLIG